MITIKERKEKTKNWWKQNLANLVTVTGVISAFLFLRTAFLEPNNIAKQIIYALITAITDFIDGRIARDTNTVSTFGSYIDRIRDRIFVYPGIIILGWNHKEKIVFPELLISLMASLVFFEILIFRIGAVGYSWYRKGKDINLQPNNFGKKKMFAGFSVILIWLISLWSEYQGIALLKYSMWIIYLGLSLMTYWSYVSWKEYAHREIKFGRLDAEGKVPHRNSEDNETQNNKTQ